MRRIIKTMADACSSVDRAFESSVILMHASHVEIIKIRFSLLFLAPHIFFYQILTLLPFLFSSWIFLLLFLHLAARGGPFYMSISTYCFSFAFPWGSIRFYSQ